MTATPPTGHTDTMFLILWRPNTHKYYSHKPIARHVLQSCKWMITAKMTRPYLMKCLAARHIVSHLCDADSLASFYRLEAECLEFFIVHRLGQVMDTQTSLWHEHIYVPKLGPLYFFKLRETDDTKCMIKCKINYYALKIILQVLNG